MRWRPIVTGAVVVGIVAWLIVQRITAADPATAGKPGGGGQSGPGKLTARVQVLHTEPLNQEVEVSGSLLANEEVVLTSEASGKIIGIYFQEGARVQRGQLLVQLNNAELKAQLSQADSRMKLLEAQEYRQRVLLEREAVSQQEYDIVANDYRGAKAAIEVLQAQLAETQVFAPFNGTIGLRRISLGSYVQAGTAIATLQNLDEIKIEFSVPEKYATTLKRGDAIRFRVRSTDTRYRGTVFAIEPKIDAATRSLQVRARAKNPGTLTPGAFADVELTLGTDPKALLVPTQSVLTEQGGQLVYQVKNGVVKPTPITVGTRLSNFVQVNSGLAAGDTVLVSGILQAKAGMVVTASEVLTTTLTPPAASTEKPAVKAASNPKKN